MSSHPFLDIHSHCDSNDPEIITIRSISLELQNLQNARFTVGLHPWKLQERPADWKNSLSKLLDSKNCFGLGECGLDRSIDEPIEFQKKLFKEQLELFKGHHKKLVVTHLVKTYSDIIEYLKAYPEFHFIFHEYNGSSELTDDLLKYNCSFSYGKKIFNPQTKAFKSLSNIALDRLFCETDDSDYKIQEVYREMAKLKEVSLRDLKEKIYHNFTNVMEDELQSTEKKIF